MIQERLRGVMIFAFVAVALMSGFLWVANRPEEQPLFIPTSTVEGLELSRIREWNRDIASVNAWFRKRASEISDCIRREQMDSRHYERGTNRIYHWIRIIGDDMSDGHPEYYTPDQFNDEVKFAVDFVDDVAQTCGIEAP